MGTTSCRILYQNKSRVWNTQNPLQLGRDYLLEVKNGTLLIRDFLAEQGNQGKLLHFPFRSPVQEQKINLKGNRTLIVSPVHYPQAISFEEARR